MKRTELSKVMRRAWAIARTTGKTFAVCLAKSWQLYRLAKQMRAGVVRFAYEKKDGTLRRAVGTLKDIVTLIVGTGRPDDGHTFKYYDTEAAAFRLFRVENLIAIY